MSIFDNYLSKKEEINNDNLSLTLQESDEIYKDSAGGHGLYDHVIWVAKRALDIADKVNKNPEFYNAVKPLDKRLVLASAILHDVGNTVNRKFHNLYAKGIAEGELSFTDCIKYNTKVPVNIRLEALYVATCSSKRVDFSSDEWDNMSEEEIKKSAESINKQVTECIKDAFITKAKFDLTYFNKIDLPKTEFEKDLFEIMVSDTDTMKEVLSSVSYNPLLQEFTAHLHDAIPKDSPEMKTLVDAVASHNIDFEDETNKSVRHVDSNIYSRIIFDADKDNIPEVFAYRTLAFAINNWTKKNPDLFVNKDGTLNKELIVHHVLDQSNERFRCSFADYVRKTGNTEPMPIFDTMLKYKTPAEIAVMIPAGYPVGSKYEITKEAGVDIFSQVDAGAKGNSKEIIKLRSSALDKLQEWADPANEEKSLTEVSGLYDSLVMAEKDLFIKNGGREEDFVFSAVSDKAIGNLILEMEVKHYGIDLAAYDGRLSEMFEDIICDAFEKIEKEEQVDKAIKTLKENNIDIRTLVDKYRDTRTKHKVIETDEFDL